jgi:HEPN domain-containing protein
MPNSQPAERGTRQWLEIVRKDLRRARKDLDSPPADPESAFFHCQQAIEKAMKAFLIWHGHGFKRTHDLANLGTQCIVLDQSLRPLVLRVASLTDYAVEFRYPSDLAVPTADQAEEAIALASEFVSAIVTRLPEEARVKPQSP